MEDHKDENNELKENIDTPSHKMDGKYCILMETNETDFEQWYYFIRVDGNEENLKHLASQLDKIDWEILEDSSAFDLEMDYLVSAQTAKEMSKVDLNAGGYHRKFDGKLKKIEFDFRKKDGNSTKICKVFDTIGTGQIEDYISDEDIDEEDLVTDDDSSDNESYSSSDSEDCKKNNKIPPSLLMNKLIEKIKTKKEERIKGNHKEKINYDE